MSMGHFGKSLSCDLDSGLHTCDLGMGLYSKHRGDSIQCDAKGHGALGAQAVRSHTSGKMLISRGGQSPRHVATQSKRMTPQK